MVLLWCCSWILTGFFLIFHHPILPRITSLNPILLFRLPSPLQLPSPLPSSCPLVSSYPLPSLSLSTSPYRLPLPSPSLLALLDPSLLYRRSALPMMTWQRCRYRQWVWASDLSKYKKMFNKISLKYWMLIAKFSAFIDFNWVLIKTSQVIFNYPNHQWAILEKFRLEFRPTLCQPRLD